MGLGQTSSHSAGRRQSSGSKTPTAEEPAAPPHGATVVDNEPDESSRESKARTREERTEELMARAAALAGDVAAQQACLDDVVLINAPVAEAIANRYASRGLESDDLVQVAYLGLVKAVQGYRVGEGPGFLAYAVPTISGEIKRHFRDFGWMVRPPRRVQELRSAVVSSSAELQQEQGRPPTSVEIATNLGVDVRDLAEAEMARGCYTALSLDAPTHDEGSPVLGELIIDENDPFGHVDNMELLRPALAELSERDRRILLLRFARGMTQEQIGREIGVSQMQVSRLLTRILDGLRDQLAEEGVVGAGAR